jgi:hypothetical membrane protein
MANTAVALIGGGLAVLLSTADPLSLASISRLGIDARAGVIMNAMLIGLGLSILALGLSFRRAFAGLPVRTTRGVKDIIAAGFVIAGVGVSLTGVFSVEVPASTVVHNLAGFTAPLVLIASLVGARIAFGSLGAVLDAFSVMVLAVSGVLFALAARVGLPSYPVMELSCFALIGAWLWLFEARLGHAIRSSTHRRPGRSAMARSSVRSMSSRAVSRPPVSGST